MREIRQNHLFRILAKGVIIKICIQKHLSKQKRGGY
jgi:hypothetical protein